MPSTGAGALQGGQGECTVFGGSLGGPTPAFISLAIMRGHVCATVQEQHQNSTAAPCCFGNDTVPMSSAPLMSMGGSVAWLPGSSIHPCSITQLTAVFTSSTVCLTRPVFFLGNSSAAPTAARGPNPAQDSNILWYPCNTSELPYSTAGGAGAHVEEHHPSSIRTPNPGAVPALCAL